MDRSNPTRAAQPDMAVSPPPRSGWRWSPARVSVAGAAAETLLRAAIERAPDSEVLRLRLAGLMYDQGHWSEVEPLLAPLTAANHAQALHLIGLCRLADRNLDGACMALAKAVEQGANARTDLAEALLLKDGGEAVAGLCEAILADNPDDVAALAIAGGQLLRRGDVGGLDRLCRDLAARGAANAQLLALQASVCDARGDAGGLDALIDLPGCLSVSDLRIADNGDPHASRRRLANELLNHPNLTLPNPRRATVGGQRVNNALISADSGFAAVTDAIRAAVEAYAAGLPSDSRIPKGRTPGRDLDAWAVILREQARQSWHLHPRALFSGVYYVALPAVDGAAGSLEFGVLGQEERVLHRVRPVEGMLVMFPSSYVHRTLPSGQAEARISVAFDVIAA